MVDRYPLAMRHPAFQAAVISQGAVAFLGGAAETAIAPPGRPAQFPPVIVNNEDQEEYYRSRGYEPNGVFDPVAYQQQRAAPVPPGWTPSEYPKMVDGRIVPDPASTPESGFREYPKWIGDRIVQSREEEEAVVGAPAPRAPPSETLIECLAGWEAAAATPPPAVVNAAIMAAPPVARPAAPQSFRHATRPSPPRR